jgi:hypothetical protein
MKVEGEKTKRDMVGAEEGELRARCGEKDKLRMGRIEVRE